MTRISNTTFYLYSFSSDKIMRGKMTRVFCVLIFLCSDVTSLYYCERNISNMDISLYVLIMFYVSIHLFSPYTFTRSTRSSSVHDLHHWLQLYFLLTGCSRFVFFKIFYIQIKVWNYPSRDVKIPCILNPCGIQT